MFGVALFTGVVPITSGAVAFGDGVSDQAQFRLWPSPAEPTLAAYEGTADGFGARAISVVDPQPTPAMVRGRRDQRQGRADADIGASSKSQCLARPCHGRNCFSTGHLLEILVIEG